jgi:hypothetical protein
MNQGKKINLSTLSQVQSMQLTSVAIDVEKQKWTHNVFKPAYSTCHRSYVNYHMQHYSITMFYERGSLLFF